MAAVIPPAPPALPPVPTGGGPVVVTVVAAAPKVVEGLQAGAVLDAAILARGTRGAVEVALPGGTATLKLPPDLAALPQGTRLTLQLLLPDAGGLPRFSLSAVNGRMLLPTGLPMMAPAGQAPAMMGMAQPGVTATGLPTPPNPLVPNQPGVLAVGQPAATPGPLGITATILRPAASPGSVPAGAPPVAGGGGLPVDLAPGTTLVVRIAGTAPAGAPAPTPSPVVVPQTTPQAPPAAQPATPGPTPATPAAQPAPAPVPSSPPLPAAPPPPVLTGTVTAQPPGGQVVVQTPVGSLALPTRAELPVGTQVVLDVVGRPEPPPPLPPPTAAKSEGLTQAGWPALTEATQTLARSDAQLADQFLRVLPQANHRLAASMALFAGALRSGDARQIISDAVTRGLERAGKRDVADKVKGDVDKLSAESTRTLGGGEWRAYAMPFVNGAAIEPIRLFVRQVGGDDERKRSGGQGDGQRFILEISMRALGRIQLDGMVRRDDKTFDLIMRTQDPLPADMRRDILAIFADNCEVCGTKGMVVFQTGRFVDLPPDTNPTALMV